MPLASGPLGFFGPLIVIIIALLTIGVFLAATVGPIALVIAAIVKSPRSSTRVKITTSFGTRVVALDPGQGFGQAFSATLQQGLGQQLGQSLAQIMALAAAQHPLAVQLAPIVLAIDTARRQGEVASVRAFLTDRFAARFTGSAASGSPVISHLTQAHDGTVAPGDHVVIRVDRAAGTAGHSEYWSFQRDMRAAPDGTPAECPRCGAPTAGDAVGSCRFCGGTFSTSAPVLPSPARWLLDDISAAPPALAA